MDQRERFSDDEEALRSAVAGVMKHYWNAVVSIVSHDSDGRTLQATPAIKRRDIDQNGNTTFNDHPLLVDVPIHHPGGGGVTHTFPIKQADEILSVIASRPPESWFQSGGQQNPLWTRTHSLSDAIAIPGLRSTPRQLEQISTTSAQVRDDAKLNVIDHAPGVGTTHFSADPSTAPASPSFDPFSQATTFYKHIVQAAAGILGQAVSPAGTHEHGVAHDVGAFMRALGGLHQVLCHPEQGALLSAANGAHTVQATPSGVDIQSATAISLTAPPGGLSLAGLAGGSIGGGALASGAAAENVGTVGGDLAGELPNPQVVGIQHVAGANALPVAANDAAAASLVPPVPVGCLYRNGSQLMVRVA